MPVSRCFTFAGSALLVLLFACHAYFYDAYFHKGVALSSDELHWTESVTPAARVRETFALFVPEDARRMRDGARLLAQAAKPQA